MQPDDKKQDDDDEAAKMIENGTDRRAALESLGRLLFADTPPGMRSSSSSAYGSEGSFDSPESEHAPVKGSLKNKTTLPTVRPLPIDKPLPQPAQLASTIQQQPHKADSGSNATRAATVVAATSANRHAWTTASKTSQPSHPLQPPQTFWTAASFDHLDQHPIDSTSGEPLPLPKAFVELAMPGYFSSLASGYGGENGTIVSFKRSRSEREEQEECDEVIRLELAAFHGHLIVASPSAGGGGSLASPGFSNSSVGSPKGQQQQTGQRPRNSPLTRKSLAKAAKSGDSYRLGSLKKMLGGGGSPKGNTRPSSETMEMLAESSSDCWSSTTIAFSETSSSFSGSGGGQPTQHAMQPMSLRLSSPTISSASSSAATTPSSLLSHSSPRGRMTSGTTTLSELSSFSSGTDGSQGLPVTTFATPRIGSLAFERPASGRTQQSPPPQQQSKGPSRWFSRRPKTADAAALTKRQHLVGTYQQPTGAHDDHHHRSVNQNQTTPPVPLKTLGSETRARSGSVPSSRTAPTVVSSSSQEEKKSMLSAASTAATSILIRSSGASGGTTTPPADYSTTKTTASSARSAASNGSAGGGLQHQLGGNSRVPTPRMSSGPTATFSPSPSASRSARSGGSTSGYHGYGAATMPSRGSRTTSSHAHTSLESAFSPRTGATVSSNGGNGNGTISPPPFDMSQARKRGAKFWTYLDALIPLGEDCFRPFSAADEGRIPDSLRDMSLADYLALYSLGAFDVADPPFLIQHDDNRFGTSSGLGDDVEYEEGEMMHSDVSRGPSQEYSNSTRMLQSLLREQEGRAARIVSIQPRRSWAPAARRPSASSESSAAHSAAASSEAHWSGPPEATVTPLLPLATYSETVAKVLVAAATMVVLGRAPSSSAVQDNLALDDDAQDAVQDLVAAYSECIAKLVAYITKNVPRGGTSWRPTMRARKGLPVAPLM